MSATAPQAVVFLEQEYNYRNPLLAVFLVIFGGIAGLMLIGLAELFLNFPAEFAAGKAAWWQPLLGIVVAVPFVGPAVYVGWLFLWRPRWQVRIDDRGITFGHQFFGWERITWIGVSPSGQLLHWHFGYYPVFHLQSRWPLALHRGLPLWPTLTSEQAEELLDRLDEYLSEKFPEVDVG